MDRTRITLLILSFVLFATSALAAVGYKMKYNAQTGRGDWVLDETTLPAGSMSGTINPATAGYVPYYSGSSTLDQSAIYYNGTNIGIGTSSPLDKLHVSGDMLITGNDLKMNSGDYQAYVGNYNTGSSAGLSLLAAGDVKATITSDGNVGIGTSNPVASLDVVPAAVAYTPGTGGTVIESGGLRTHIFTSGTSTFVAPIGVSTIELLIIGGGGSGGNDKGGGGGAGGKKYDPAYPIVQGGSYSVTVGAANSNTIFGPLTAYAGGIGGSVNSNGSNGASGGGAGGSASAKTGGTATPAGQGNNGGSNGGYTGSPFPCGGGGGAEGPGNAPQNSSTGGLGGLGFSSNITGSTVVYAKGGNGCWTGSSGVSPAPNTGNGGNGGDNSALGTTGASGIVVARYGIPATATSAVLQGKVSVNTSSVAGAVLTIKGNSQDNTIRAVNYSDAVQLVVSYDGNVGIGTTTPTSSIASANRIVDIAGTSSPAITLHSSSTAQEASISSATGAGINIDVAGHATATNNNIIFSTEETNSQYTPTERMRITSAGNVGIGTTSPVNKLDVNGTFHVSDQSTFDGNIGVGTMVISGGVTINAVTTGYALCVTASKQLGHCTAGTYPACTTCVAN